MVKNLTAGKLLQGSLPLYPWSRAFGDTIILVVIATVMSMGCGAVLMMLLEGGVKAVLGLISSDVRDVVFVANADLVAAISRLLGHAIDCLAALMFLWGSLGGKPVAEALSLNVRRLRFGWLQALLYAGLGFCVYKLAVWLVYDYFAFVAVSGSGGLVKTASQLSGWPMAVMMLQTLVFAPILEEVVHRGFIYNILRSSLRVSLGRHVWLADLLACLFGAGLFTMLHVTASAPLAIFIGAIIMTELYRRTGSLVCPILMHLMLNAWVWYTLLT
jgi:membrane protease YdiL (CAAX protease family)